MSSPKILVRDPVSGDVEALSALEVSDSVKYTYPGDSTKNKPEIVVSKCEDLRKAYKSVKQNFNEGQLILEEVLSYIVHTMDMAKAKCVDKDWISYGLTIGKKDEDVTPADILTITTDSRKLDWTHKQDDKANPNENDHMTLVAHLLGIYRLGKIRSQAASTYREEVAQRMETVLSTSPFTPIITKGRLSIVATLNVGWTGLKSFRMLVGAFDMFFMKFEHVFSGIRVGTVVTAYEDCSGLTSMSYFANKLGIPVEQAVQYMMHGSFYKELNMLWKPGQEIDIPDSYFIHFKALGLSGKSPYSSNAVGHIFNLIHFTGCYLGDKRSLNAVMIQNSAPGDMATLGAFIGDMFHMSISYKRVFYENESDLKDQLESEAAMGDIEDDDPEKRDGDNQKEDDQTLRTPNALYIRLTSNDGKMTPDMRKRYKDVIKNINIRPGSFAEYLETL